MSLPIPRGGPVSLPNLVGSLITPPLFESRLLSELEDLTQELRQDSSEIDDEDDLSVDDLKIVTEEDLVNKAFDIAFKDDDQLTKKDPPVSPSCEPSDVNKKRSKSQNNDKKRKTKRQKKATVVEESYIAKVKELVRIKEKQVEDKATVKLHSFNGSCKTSDSVEKNERTTPYTSNDSTAKANISSTHQVQLLQPGKEIVLCVEVYHNKRNMLKTQEFLVLGRQFLTELRDQICCSTDQLMKRAGKHDTSGYFLIEDAFCNDMRDESAIDYSKPILDWLKDSNKEALEKWEYILSGSLQPKQKALVEDNKRKENLPRFKALQMQDTRFCDLNFRLGAGYLYCHQGDCKHTIVIRDMRLIHPEDIQNRFAYPVVTFQIKSRVQKCSVCRIFRAKLVTVDDKWAEENPCYFCDTCYYMLHYANESLLYPDFSVHDYYHD